MKKKLLALGLSSVMLLCACGSNDTQAQYLKDVKADKYVAVGEYKGLTVQMTAEEPAVTEEEVEYSIQYILEGRATAVEVTDRAVQNGDITNIDYEGKMDGVAFEGGTAQGYDLTIGSGQFIPGFEEGMIGMEIGETRDVEVTFPDPYLNNPDMSGKPAIFTVTVNSISVLELPELTDEFVAGLGTEECSTVEEFRQYMSDSILEEKQLAYEEEKEAMALDQIMQTSEFKKDMPEGMITRLKDGLMNNVGNYASMYGMSLPDYVAAVYGGTAETYDTTLTNLSVEMAKQYMVMQVIAEKEGLTVSDEELETKIAEEATAYGYETVDAYKEAIDVEAYREYLMMEKVLDFLRDNTGVAAE